MIDRAQRRWMGLAAALCLAVATALVGFAHRPLPGFVSVAAAIDGAGVSFGSFCVGRDRVAAPDGATPIGRAAPAVCDACLLFAAPGLGAVAEIEIPAWAGRTFDRFVPGDASVSSRFVPVARARGPPLPA